ncbi:hypothetical protein M440DRAFT_188882 [Trichoderma longibrachiatum ATCC 18648]|uniref:Uncharacterized protein n=1 Tax=Trichoderma longibrachiatum ATCC 18648 TaxID=983965 RepID=A0A2T4CFC6_TRILO|nr:hypothetical protein M440DRAFT_188882 [Trichoderma longibrachiatum ATCC 18648]
MHQPWSLGILILISPAIFFVCRLALSERKHVRVSQKRSWFRIRAVFAVSQSIFVDCISVSGDLGHTLCALPHLQGPLRILLNDVNTLNSIAAKHPISPLSLLLFGTYPLSVLACFSMASHALHARTSSAWVRPSCPLFCPVSRPSFPLPFPLCPPLSHTHVSRQAQLSANSNQTPLETIPLQLRSPFSQAQAQALQAYCCCAAAHRLLCLRPHAAAIGPRGSMLPDARRGGVAFRRLHLPAIRPFEQTLGRCVYRCTPPAWLAVHGRAVRACAGSCCTKFTAQVLLYRCAAAMLNSLLAACVLLYKGGEQRIVFLHTPTTTTTSPPFPRSQTRSMR